LTILSLGTKLSLIFDPEPVSNMKAMYWFAKVIWTVDTRLYLSRDTVTVYIFNAFLPTGSFSISTGVRLAPYVTSDNLTDNFYFINCVMLFSFFQQLLVEWPGLSHYWQITEDLFWLLLLLVRFLALRPDLKHIWQTILFPCKILTDCRAWESRSRHLSALCPRFLQIWHISSKIN